MPDPSELVLTSVLAACGVDLGTVDAKPGPVVGIALQWRDDLLNVRFGPAGRQLTTT